MYIATKIIATCFMAFSIFGSLVPSVKKPRVYLAGGSTIANKDPSRYPETGWGQVLGCYFTTEVEIINLAANGSSTKTFINQKRWDKLMKAVTEGDYVFIGFGHNDEKINRPLVGSTLEEYESNLLKFVREVKLKKGIPVLLTPLMRRSVKGGNFYNSHGGYPAAVRKVAISEDVFLIDMLEKSKLLLEVAGVNESKKFFLHADSGQLTNFPKGIKDNTHLSRVGACEMARLVVEGIIEIKLPIGAYVRKPACTSTKTNVL